MEIEPLVSICIPNFNSQEFIEEAILSAINQTYPNIEIIVADNCSTDHSWKIISALKSKYPTLKTIQHSENIGMVENFRSTYANATGAYISFLCSDDKLYPHAIENVIEMYKQHPTLNFIFGNIDQVGARSGATNYSFNTIFGRGDWTRTSINEGKNLAYLTGTVFKNPQQLSSNVIQDLVFFDWYLWLTLGQGEVGFHRNTMGHHRYHNNNQTTILTPGKHKNVANLILVYDRLLQNKNIITEQYNDAKQILVQNWAKGEIEFVHLNNLFSQQNPLFSFYKTYLPLTLGTRLYLYYWIVYAKLQIMRKYGFRR